VHWRCKLVSETLFLAVEIMDRFLERKNVPKAKFQLVGVTCLLIASKYEDIYPPEVSELIMLTDYNYSKDEILRMETIILNSLQYKITICTIHCFLLRFLKAAHADRHIIYLASYIAERMLQEYSMLKYLPSTIAASSVYLTRRALGRYPWSPTLLKYTRYRPDSLRPCMEEMIRILNFNSENNAVKKKFNKKYDNIADTPIGFDISELIGRNPLGEEIMG